MVTGEGQIGTLPEVPQGPHSSIGNGQIVAYSPLQAFEDHHTRVVDKGSYRVHALTRG